MIPDVKKSIPYTVCKKALLHQPFFLQACEDSIPDNDMVQQVKIHKGTGSGYLLCQLNIRYGRVRKSAGMIMYQSACNICFFDDVFKNQVNIKGLRL